MPLIEAKNVEKTYDIDGVKTHALRGVSFDIKRGEFVAIMGPSGSGKSTLLHILGFLDEHSKGEYRFDNKTMADYSKNEVASVRNEKMGFVFQMFNLLNRASALDNVKLPLLYSGIKESRWNDLAKQAIEKVGLKHRLGYRTSQLSGGERQRVAIARALVLKPQVIFADEPTGNLDSTSGGQIMNILEKLHNEGNTILLITHETYTAQYAQRIIYLRDGKVESDKIVDHRRVGAKDKFVK